MGTDATQAATLYCETTARVTAILTAPEMWQAAVPTCPGWSVRDVVSHMVAVARDWADEVLTGPPTDEETAEHIRRFDGLSETELLDAWTEAATTLRRRADTDGLEPPVGDIACHEHDIRGAIGRPGARDADSVIWISDRLLTILQPPVPLRVVVEDGDYHCGPAGDPEITLRTTRFEALRWRTGRRSGAQLAAMDWADDPGAILDHLYLFGPAAVDIIE